MSSNNITENILAPEENMDVDMEVSKENTDVNVEPLEGIAEEMSENIVDTPEEHTETQAEIVPNTPSERSHKILQVRGFCYNSSLYTPEEKVDFMNCVHLLESYSHLYDVLIINTPAIVFQDVECMNVFQSMKLVENRTAPVFVISWCPADRVFQMANIMSNHWKVGEPSIQLFCDWSVGYSKDGVFTPYVDGQTLSMRHIKVGSGIILDSSKLESKQPTYGSPNTECMLMSMFYPDATTNAKFINKSTQQSLATYIPRVIHCSMTMEQFKQHHKANIDVFRPEHAYQTCLRIFSHTTNVLIGFGKYVPDQETNKPNRKTKSLPSENTEEVEQTPTENTEHVGDIPSPTENKKNITRTPTLRTVHHISGNTVGYYSGSKKYPDLKQLFRTYIGTLKMDEPAAKRLSSTIRLFISSRTSNHQKYMRRINHILESIFIPESAINIFLSKLDNTKEDKEKIAMHAMMETLNDMIQSSQFRAKRNKRKNQTDKEGETEPQPPRKRGNFQLSEILQNFIGDDTTKSCCKVMSKIHSYIKEKELQSPEDKACFKIDTVLSPIFDMEPGELLPYFKMPNKLKSHYIQAPTPAPVVQEE
jgi:chromatin remodeling complex protein RSC6